MCGRGTNQIASGEISEKEKKPDDEYRHSYLQSVRRMPQKANQKGHRNGCDTHE
jgi:uncharacterized protein YnzC (UPF0291/DUF896 family)